MAKTYRGDGIVLRRKTWWLDCVIDGTRHQRKLGKSISRSAAVELSLKYRVEILGGNLGYGKKVKDLTFDEARAKFESWCVANKKAGTVRSYKECLLRLAVTFSGKRLSQISSFHIEAHKQGRIKAGAKVRANREVSVLKSLYNRCAEWTLFKGENPVNLVALTKEPRRRLRFLEPAEEARLLAACGDPFRTLILLGIHTGLRLRSEAMTLRWDSVDLGRRTVTVQAAYSKTGVTRTVPLNSRVRAALERLPRTDAMVFGTLSFTGLRRGFDAACREAGLSDVTPHTLRHTFATRLIETGTDLRTVQELGGWAQLKMLERYGHVTTARKADAVERLAGGEIFTPRENVRLVETA